MFVGDFVSYYLIDMASLSYNLGVCICCSIVYFVISSLVVYFWYITTKADPSDPTIRAQRLAALNDEWFDGSPYEYMCEVCETHVLEGSKHCGTCNRCVNEFDHHCFWINNCVGIKNYKDFYRLIIVAFLMTTYHNITNAVVITMFLT